MRIYSKFSDYYDTILGYGIDPNVVYSRKTRSYKYDSPMGKKLQKNLPIIEEKFDSLYISRWNRGNDPYIDRMFFILFCGKIYVAIQMEMSYHPNNVSAICYSVDDVKRFYEKYKKKMPIFKKEKGYFRKRRSRKVIDRTLSEKNFKNFFSTFTFDQPVNNKVVDLHFEFDSPIILVEKSKYSLEKSGKIVINPILKKIEFVRHIDAFTTFQELSMFIGGVMGGKVPAMIEISNDDKIAKHGFNKMSFRKEKEK